MTRQKKKKKLFSPHALRKLNDGITGTGGGGFKKTDELRIQELPTGKHLWAAGNPHPSACSALARRPQH